MFSPTSAEICPPSPSSSSSSSPIFLPVYRKRKASRSPSPLDLSLEVNQPQESRTEFCPTSVTEAKTRWDADEDGTPGPKRISSEDLVKSKLSDYKSYFQNLSPTDSLDGSQFSNPNAPPFVDLEYPNTGASERFILLAPRRDNCYHPILDLELSLYTIIECFVPRGLKASFGPIPYTPATEILSTFEKSHRLIYEPCVNRPVLADSPDSDAVSLSSDFSDFGDVIPVSNPPGDHLLLTIRRAIESRDGPLFMSTMQHVGNILRSIKNLTEACVHRNPIMSHVASWTDRTLEERVAVRILMESYQRAVGPNISQLGRYRPFSRNTYGELMPSLINELICITGLTNKSLFLDLGSGVGNVAVQVSLQTGCRSFGIEESPTPSQLAQSLLDQIKIRCRMWGLRMGDVELAEEDMLTSARVEQLLPHADVILINNKLFPEEVNQAIAQKLLSLKDGAYAISLNPFVGGVRSKSARRTFNEIEALLDVSEHLYNPGDVSWTDKGDKYYIHRVNRANV